MEDDSCIIIGELLFHKSDKIHPHVSYNIKYKSIAFKTQKTVETMVNYSKIAEYFQLVEIHD